MKPPISPFLTRPYHAHAFPFPPTRRRPPACRHGRRRTDRPGPARRGPRPDPKRRPGRRRARLRHC
ncbi:hypothetical protein FGX02_01375, partial [Xylella fastidiosa subsp. multiplex]|nr:hypothetical protein [Xylella fastidiosa subsp. multiplex]